MDKGGDQHEDRRRREHWTWTIAKIAANLSFYPGPVTDYGSTTVQWMRNRRPRYQQSSFMEAERPSPSYIVDVGTFHAHFSHMLTIH